MPLTLHSGAGQEIATGLPAAFPFPAVGDPRRRAVDRRRLDPARRYMPLVEVTDAAGKTYGDAACYIELGAGPAKGGRLLYLGSTLQATPEGQALLAEGVPWVLEQRLK